VLIGNLDRGVLNFILYMADVIDKIDWIESDDLKIFLGIIYPYCDVSLRLKELNIAYLVN